MEPRERPSTPPPNNGRLLDRRIWVATSRIKNRHVPSEAQAPQPDHNVHRAPTISGGTSSSGAEKLSREGLDYAGRLPSPFPFQDSLPSCGIAASSPIGFRTSSTMPACVTRVAGMGFSTECFSLLFLFSSRYANASRAIVYLCWLRDRRGRSP